MNLPKVGMMSLAALAMAGSAGALQAEQQATFHLPVTAHWGLAILEPGDYRMVLPAPSLGRVAFSVDGNGKTMYELPIVTDVEGSLTATYLQLTQVGGDYYVSGFSSKAAGKQFKFGVPKQKSGQQLAKAEDAPIPVVLR